MKTEKMPGHRMPARMGKRVLRPGGMELTRRMLAALDIGPSDEVVEFAPGLSVTARLTLALNPKSYKRPLHAFPHAGVSSQLTTAGSPPPLRKVRFIIPRR